MLRSIVAAVFDTGENLPESADMLDFAEMLTGARGKVPRVSQLMTRFRTRFKWASRAAAAGSHRPTRRLAADRGFPSRLAESLKAANVGSPASVTKVVFTHAHPDHIWGTLGADDNLFMPNAAYYVGATEWNFWTAPDLLSKMPAEMGDFVKGAQRDLAAVKDRVTMVKAGDEIAPGIAVLDTPGHTPGHLSLEVAGGEGLIITADATTNQIVSFEHPEWKFGFDADPTQAIDTRKKLLDRAAADKVKLLGFHWQYPGVGFAEKKNSASLYAAG